MKAQGASGINQKDAIYTFNKDMVAGQNDAVFHCGHMGYEDVIDI